MSFHPASTVSRAGGGVTSPRLFLYPERSSAALRSIGGGNSERSLADVERVQRDDVTATTTRVRRARSVNVIVDNHLIAPGELLVIDLEGVINAAVVKQVEEWVAENPERGRARWQADRHRPLVWCAEPDDAGSWTPTGLAQHIICAATGDPERKTPSGPDVWVHNGYSLYGIASDFLDADEATSDDTDDE